VMAGSISRWGYHVAGNMISADVQATPDYRIDVVKAGDGAGTVSSSEVGIACGASCSTTVASGSSLHLTATPSSGSSFFGWSGGGCTGAATCTVTVTGPATVTATFLSGVLPTVTQPKATLRTGVTLSGSSIPVRLTWTGADVNGPGVDHYILQRSSNGGSTWTSVSGSMSSPTADVVVPSSGTVRFRVRAVDSFDRSGLWATGPTLTPRLVQQSSTAVRYGSGWTTTKSSLLSGGSARYAKAARSTASYAFTGRSIALVSTTALSRGKVKVYVNGVYLTTVDLRSSSTRYRALVWQRAWSTSATRTIKLVVVGTSGRPRVDLDAFVTLK
jgi:hypothetical protein